MKSLDELLSLMGLTRADLKSNVTDVAVDKTGEVFAWIGKPVYVDGYSDNGIYENEWVGYGAGVTWATVSAYLGDVYTHLSQHAKMEEMIFPVE